MTTTELLAPILDGGVYSTNFFNGRMLSGEDLQTEQEAARRIHRRLGQAVGAGIVYGLEVSKMPGVDSKTSPTVRIEPGLAINRRGGTLQLSSRIDLALTSTERTSDALNVISIFEECRPIQPGVYVAGTGVYLLTISPAKGKMGRAPVSGLGNTDALCNSKYIVDGVLFRRIPIELTSDELSDENRLRNLIAYKCFGYENKTRLQILANPFGPQTGELGLLAEMRSKKILTDCDVPLAILYWSAADGIEFIDLWSVRRRLIPKPYLTNWHYFIDQRKAVEAESAFLQFQDHIISLANSNIPQSALSSMKASDYFQYLPAAGIIPVSGVNDARGFEYLNFFAGHTYRDPVYIEGAKLESLLSQSLHYPPIEIGTAELIWLYLVRENIESIRNELNPFQPYLVFTTGHMPFAGSARFDLARWDYSNYASVLE